LFAEPGRQSVSGGARALEIGNISISETIRAHDGETLFGFVLSVLIFESAHKQYGACESRCQWLYKGETREFLMPATRMLRSAASHDLLII